MWKRTASGRLKFGGDRNRIFGAFKVFELVGGGVVQGRVQCCCYFHTCKLSISYKGELFELSLKLEPVYILRCI